VEIALNLVGGIISSILAVFVVEAYRLMRTRYDHRALRQVTQFSESRCAIIAPTFPVEATELPRPTGLLTLSDATALAYVLDVCSTIKCQTTVVSHKRIESDIGSGIICIGGSFGNDATKSMLNTYCAGFHIHSEGGFRATYYQCGEHRFGADPENAYAFVVKLSSGYTGLPGNVILLWGHYGVATTAAAYFLVRDAKALAALKKESFFVALSLNLSLGYRSISTSMVDLSDVALIRR